MDELTLTFWLVAFGTIFLSGVSKAGFGAGFEALNVPIFALFISPQFAAAVILPILVVIDLANLWRWRKSWNRDVVVRMLPPIVVGIIIGSVLFTSINADALRVVVGALALVFFVQRIWMPIEAMAAKKPGRASVIALSITAGFTSTLAHAGGPPAKIALLRENLSKESFIGTNSYLFAGINGLKLPAYIAIGQFSAESLLMSFQLALIVPFGIAAGWWLNKRVEDGLFNRIILIALGLAGVRLVWDGLSGLI